MMDYNKISNNYDMLQGNINRMILTQSLKELETVYNYALKRLATIFEEKKEDLKSKFN